jgi:hypothetical protein
VVDGEPRIISDPPLIVPVEELYPQATADDVLGVLREFIRGYRRSLQTDRRVLLEQFRFVHLARKVVGVGSVGTRAWIALFLGRNGEDPLFLQVKEAQASVLEEFAGKSVYARHGERVVAGQHLMQASSDIFLGWRTMANPIEGVERNFYVRQLKDWKGSAEIESMDPASMKVYGRLCGWTLARAHARSGDRVAIAAAQTHSTKRSRLSPSRTPTRTSVTMTRCKPLRTRARSRCRPGCSPPHTHCAMLSASSGLGGVGGRPLCGETCVFRSTRGFPCQLSGRPRASGGPDERADGSVTSRLGL